MRKGEVEIVPGVVGPEVLTYDDNKKFVHFARAGKGEPLTVFEVSYSFRFDHESHRYGCDKLTVHVNPATSPTGPITTAALRDIVIKEAMVMELLVNTDPEDPVIRDLPNPDGREPWGRMPPEGLANEGPTDRALRWVAHLYRFAVAVGFGPKKAVEESLGLSRPTAGRWIAAARKQGFLGPAEVGKAGG
jgi:hypothetical protein